MIVRDEEQTLARCLNCIKSFADEIIIVDTGSTDGTVGIARAFTDGVYRFEWQDDFAAARNFSFSKAHGDFVMWLDADDVITSENAEKILAIKERDDFDVAFLRYAAAFDGDRPTFVYERERIVRRSLNLQWEGEVHEALTPCGRIIHSDACVYHKKVKKADGARNLNIYRKLISGGKKLSPRQKFYYGRELFFNGLYAECIAVLSDFLCGDGWVENKIEACRTLYFALKLSGRQGEAVRALVYAFTLDRPRARDCCELAALFEQKNDVRSAIFWYSCALSAGDDVIGGGFTEVDYLAYIPAIRLCVLYAELGEDEIAENYNEIAGEAKPDDKSVIHNRLYFKQKLKKG